MLQAEYIHPLLRALSRGEEERKRGREEERKRGFLSKSRQNLQPA